MSYNIWNDFINVDMLMLQGKGTSPKSFLRNINICGFPDRSLCNFFRNVVLPALQRGRKKPLSCRGNTSGPAGERPANPRNLAIPRYPNPTGPGHSPAFCCPCPHPTNQPGASSRPKQ